MDLRGKSHEMVLVFCLKNKILKVTQLSELLTNISVSR